MSEEIKNDVQNVEQDVETTKPRVAYYYDPNIGNYSFGKNHPFKPHRIRITHNLISAYELCKDMDTFNTKPISFKELMRFHTDDYVNYLQIANSPNVTVCGEQFNICEDNPVISGIYEYICSYCTGSIEGARRLVDSRSDIVINWSGGMSHAKKAEASGFCYANDVVLAILELLKKFSRVLYIDLDIHHADGVEEAFYTTDRVMTVSFHRFGDFFPGTGSPEDIGFGKGKGYSINFPLRPGIDDDAYLSVFKPLVTKAIERYQPDAIVLQSGADSLAGDRMGCFNLSMKGHGECVQFVASFHLPLLVLGGGGYTIRNVVRCWTYETALLLGKELDNQLPPTDYSDYFSPEQSLFFEITNMENENDPTQLKEQLNSLLSQLDSISPPSADNSPVFNKQTIPFDALDTFQLYYTGWINIQDRHKRCHYELASHDKNTSHSSFQCSHSEQPYFSELRRRIRNSMIKDHITICQKLLLRINPLLIL